VAIDEKVLGPDHPDLARIIANLASLLQAKGDYKAAESLYRRALAIYERALEPNHPPTQKIRQRLDSVSLMNASQKPEK
jgi:tetratricopeptide (TPR) repeat protein